MNLHGKIDKEGYLSIERGKKFKRQGCIYSNGPGYCGDWCPQFGEPDYFRYKEHKDIRLDICQGRTLYFDKLEDER